MNYTLTISNNESQKIATGWLALGLASLIFAGLFSLLLVLSRTPAVQEIIPWADFFHTALVVHVDLSVLIWFLSFASVLWSLNSQPKQISLGKFALALAVIGTVIIIISPFTGAGSPLLNNYIPVLQHPLFYAGLICFSTGVCLQLIRSLSIPVKTNEEKSGEAAIRFALKLAAFVTIATFIAFAFTWLKVPTDIEATSYFEFLFWGSGHILQFNHTILLLAAWLWLASACGASTPLSSSLAKIFFTLTAIPVLMAPVIYSQHEILSSEHRLAFTQLMQFGGLASLPLGLFVGWTIFSIKKPTGAAKPLHSSLIASLILFAAGGIIGFMIEGVNVVIPAHYHGSIVGVTLAFMGLTYALLPQLGFSAPRSKMAFLQPYIYGGGQLMHILGLAWSGGYGVQRKTAGAAQGLDRLPEIAGMAMMGLGGLISIIGGLLFLIVAIGAMRQKQVK